jgi:uncharacterized protein (TIGR02246 family)
MTRTQAACLAAAGLLALAAALARGGRADPGGGGAAARPGFSEAGPRRPVATYSIVARDPATGDLGVAVQSHWFSVGSIVSWAEAGVGAVATQSFVDPSYGPLGLALMRAGRSAPETLTALLAGDSGREVRQVAMIDAQGRAAAHTGARDIPAAGHVVGDNFSVQANLMRSDAVWPAMARAFEAARGDLAERLLAALEAAEAAGGDIRGRQSAALLVVSGRPTGRPWADRRFDLRVDDDPDPLGQLRRLAVLQRAYNHMNAGDLAVETGDDEAALREYAAAARLVPGHAEMTYWHAVALVNMGRLAESLPLFREVFALDRSWAELTPRLPRSGLLPGDRRTIRRIVAESPPAPPAPAGGAGRPAAGAAPGEAASGPGEPAREIEALLAAQTDAWNRGDLEGFCAFYADDAVFLAPEGAVRGRAAVLERYRRRYPDRRAMGALSIVPLDLRLASGPSGIQATLAARWALARPDRPLATGHTLIVLQGRSGRWEIVQDASM